LVAYFFLWFPSSQKPTHNKNHCLFCSYSEDTGKGEKGPGAGGRCYVGLLHIITAFYTRQEIEINKEIENIIKSTK
jgi:hypothetical protein